MADTHPFAGHLVLSRHLGQGDEEHSSAQLALAEGVLLLLTRARLIIHHTKPPPAHRARCPYAQRLCSLALLMCSPAQAVSFEVAVVQRAAWPRDIFNVRAACVQVVGRGGGGHGRLFRSQRARLPLRFSILVLGPFAVGVGGGLRIYICSTRVYV